MWPFKKQEEEIELLDLNNETIKKTKATGKKVKFDPVEHKYSIDGVELTSVTGFIKNFFEPFDRDYWANWVANRDGKITEEVLQDWKERRDYGKEIHKLIEDHINGKQLAEYPNEVFEAIKLLQALPIVKINSEIIVHSEDWMIAGIIDAVIETPEGIILLDWKTTRNLRMENSYRQAKDPISHLDDCNYNRYLLQLNMYRTLFEHCYGKKVIEMGFVNLPIEGAAKYFPVQDLSNSIKSMIEY